MEPLGAMDAAFVAMETTTSHLHIAAVLVLDPPEGARSLFSPSTRFVQIRRLIGERIHLVPQLRQRVLAVPLELHHPVWADDPDFDLDDHVLRASLPSPGGRRELDRLVGDLVARPLDPERPLWEMVVVEGLEGGRTAVVAKLHHAIVDGVSGASVLARFFDLSPRVKAVDPPPPWRPAPLPGPAELLAYAAGALVRQPRVALDAVGRSLGHVVDTTSPEGDQAAPGPFRAPRTPLNGSLSTRRRYATVDVALDDVRLVGRTFGVTVTDVVLAGVAGGLRRLLGAHDALPDRPLVAMVPASTRYPGDPSLDNQITAMLVDLATDQDDPVSRLLDISSSAHEAKAQMVAGRGRLLGDLAQLAAPAVSGRLARWAGSLRLFDKVAPVANVTVSSVPGPEVPLWVAGSRVAALYPVGPVAHGLGLNVTALSYRGRLALGLLGCRRLVPDLEDLALMVDASLEQLIDLAGARQEAVG